MPSILRRFPIPDLLRLPGRRRGDDALLPGPIRGELLGAEHLADRARTLAAQQRLTERPRRRAGAPLLARLNGTRRILASAHARLTAAGVAGTDPGPAGEWLLDNFHVIEEHLREVHDSLPRGYYQELPELAAGPLAGYPRVYELATTLISHTEARVDRDNVDLFVGAFQEVATLTIGELWAIPAMLRLALLESVRRMTLRTVQRLEQVERADHWAERVRAAAEGDAADVGDVLRDFMTERPPLTAHFVARFLQQVRPSRGAFPALSVIEAWITDEAMNAEQAAAQSAQRLAITQVVMANSITSLRAIGRMDWPTAVERQSRMDAVLREDPAGFYERMTFETRDLYRHAVERIARRTGQAEVDVAHAALRLADAGAAVEGDEARRRHVGYYLVDRGLADLEQATGFRLRREEAARRWILRHPDYVLVGGILAGTIATLAALLLLAGPAGRAAWPLVLAFALLPAAEIAVNTMNQLIALVLPPGHLPKLDLHTPAGIPPDCRTAVVMPTLLGSFDEVHQALERIEAHYLANRAPNLHFALLSDFTDADTETCATDDALLATAVEGVKSLNARYAGTRSDVFYLFHRPRRYNPQEGVWMGWERKRGKLSQFNHYIRGNARDAFSVIIGDTAPLAGVRYVITLDSDTVLPPDAAALLVGTIAHPLNHAVHDEAAGRVVRGYGILQPRVGVSLPSAHRSRFAAIYSGHPGVDPYTTAVSDVYQDLYREGSYTGKGIYDVDAFEAATRGRFPENALLSHDLIEGSYARAGLATDITVYDDYPSHYLTFARRKHRWIRGDWQLLPWLTPHVWGPRGREPNRLSILSRWKIFDNLRRSTVEIAILAFLLAGWFLLPGSPLRWTLLGLAAIATPWVLSVLFAVLRPPLDRSWRAYYASVGRDAIRSAQQFALAVVFLPHQAWISLDAIMRTLWRVLVSRRNLLEWQTASVVEGATARSARAAWRTMRPVVVAVALLLAATVAMAITRGTDPDATVPLWHLALAVVPLTALWVASPAIAHALGAPALRHGEQLGRPFRRQMLRYALLHWRYFDRFVTEETSWLAPDNVQEEPAPALAARTSPTNIGLQLLATVSAYDLGLLTLAGMTTRLENAFASLARMQRYHGHFYNWYDLRTLHVLEPAYVSTVDSGNLAGHLVALRQACLALAGAPPATDGRVTRALGGALRLADERLAAAADAADPPGEARQALARAREQVRTARELLAGEADDPGILAAVREPLREAHTSALAAPLPPAQAPAAAEWIDWCLRRIAAELAAGDAGDVAARLRALAERAYAYAHEMDFRFLFDDEHKLFAIGYDRTAHTRDASFYDLLASEARLASFIAIAKDDVPVEHWFRLGRSLTHAHGATALVSWSGSMFEYLMPRLVMRSFPLTLLHHASIGAVRRHQAYGVAHGVPWGVSESAYNLRDRHLTYQYRGFGVPDLGLKRGLAHDLVVAPYASALALMVDPLPALENLAALERAGALGPYGFRDALDYSRPAPDEPYAVVGTYMAHHIGMSFVALTNALLDDVWPRRFHDDPLVRSAELLLHERIPRRITLQAPQPARPEEAVRGGFEIDVPVVREIGQADTLRPQVALLGYAPYTLMVSHAGGGRASYDGLDVTRWRADGTSDDTGQFCYVRDVTTGRTWSAGYQPLCTRPDRYQALLATDRATFLRVDGDIETRTEIVVVPEDAAEVRRVTVSNNSDTAREIEVTSYGEVVLAPGDADRAHPAFSNLFIETEWHEWCSALTATRRPRSADERRLWLVHGVATGPERVGPVSYETDRARFLGRGRSVREPVAIEADGPLPGTTGAVLDPVVSLRARLRLEPGQSASVAFTTLVATSREAAFELADRYDDPHNAQRAFDLASTAAQVELRELGISSADSARFQELAAHVLYPGPALRAPPADVAANRGAQALLWENGISGDLPIMVATIDSVDGLPTLRDLLAAHHFWRRRGLRVDFVVLNAHPPAYFQELNEEILAAISAASGTGITDTPGGVYVRRRALLSPASLLMLEATAAVLVACDGRSLAQMLDGARRIEAPVPAPAAAAAVPAAITGVMREAADWLGLKQDGDQARARRAQRRAAAAATKRGARAPAATAEPALRFDNGMGGMTEGGAYVVRVHGDHVPPAPWSNVIANPHGGFLVTERGAGYTWAESSYFFRLTPWSNDPVGDPPGEVLYLRDDESGALWSATPAPMHADVSYRVRHGAGFSSFDHERDGIVSHLSLGMAPDEAVKLSLLRLTNRDAKPRRITVTAYAEWTLGVLRERTQHQVRTRFDADARAIFAHNDFDPHFSARTAFCALSEPLTGHTADRRAFLGRNGCTADPEALHAGSLDGATGPAFDPCAALQCTLELAPGETRTVVVMLGAAADDTAAKEAIARYADAGRAAAAVADAVRAWDERLSVVTVRTPDPAFDVMLNRWALYQALACRMWGRSGLYQSSGAYGFRDQLQDVMAFLHAEPGIARAHIVRAAARQFVEGDVQHWWHPHSGRGVRTRFSDDLAWLPFVVEHYVRVTGDTTLLDEKAPFLEMRELLPGEHDVYDLPRVSRESASIYEHCVRALRRACTTGPHGLPLIGTGDWNDGMNRVGAEGRGESVWLAWFLVATLRAFSTIAHARGDAAVYRDCLTRADAYVAAVEAHGWDGEWYRRAYFDDGTPLGSAAAEECRIDAIAQSWSVISGAGDAERQVQAMQAVEDHLVREDARLIQLLAPPFDRSPLDPGYIKGYLPGVRENGAQYTHAALWTALATALAGDGDRAFALFQMLNPLMHARTTEEVQTYKVEPYVIPADVYTAEGHLGRGGWTWYTGSASWFYRVGLEAILGFVRQGDTLRIDPCVPSTWSDFTIEYRYGSTTYVITVENPAAVGHAPAQVMLDGRPLANPLIPLTDDGARHEVLVRPGAGTVQLTLDGV